MPYDVFYWFSTQVERVLGGGAVGAVLLWLVQSQAVLCWVELFWSWWGLMEHKQATLHHSGEGGYKGLLYCYSCWNMKRISPSFAKYDNVYIHYVLVVTLLTETIFSN